MRIVKKIVGLCILVIGIGLLSWVAYNYLVEMQTQARGRNPLPALVFSAAAIFVGGSWLLDKPTNKI